ncbi:hypothetical protein [Promicromonospora sp. NPDC090134]|uniref:hypothetical protein n=1 Tax=Promicromonospora sp. NPDC090134 TaxID=3364408 RepID=UPI0038222A19
MDVHFSVAPQYQDLAIVGGERHGMNTVRERSRRVAVERPAQAAPSHDLSAVRARHPLLHEAGIERFGIRREGWRNDFCRARRERVHGR